MYKEKWYPVHPVFGVKPNEYIVSDMGHIKNSRTGLNMDEYTYHSSNGYDFALLTMIDDAVQYIAIDLIVMASCTKKFKGSYGTGIIPFHLNGDTRDNRWKNLSPGENIELWKPIIYDEIKPGLYEVSNHGRFRNVINGHVTKPSTENGCYPKAKLYTIEGIAKAFDVHRLVATAFVPNHDESHDIVNHIDNIKWNNYWRNLEWVSSGENNKHAKAIRDKRISNDTLDMIRDMLMTYKSIKTTYEMLDHQKYYYISEVDIHSIKRCDGYIRSNKFTISELYQLRDNSFRIQSCFTDNDVRHFCEILVKYNMNVSDAYNHLVDEEYTISRATLYDLKIKRYHKNISDEYF